MCDSVRPLYHPSADDISLEGILFALSDPVRLRIVAELAEAACAKNCSTFLKSKGKTLAKSTLSQHFRILREAGLIRSERQGVELRNTLRCTELRERFGPLLETILKTHGRELAGGRRRR